MSLKLMKEYQPQMEAGKEPSVGNSVLPDHSRNSSIRKTSKGTSTTYGALLLKGSRILCSREEKSTKLQFQMKVKQM